MSSEQWISVVDWRRFQHYDPATRQPPWIKLYLTLQEDEAGWLALSPRRRGLLVGLWLEYAKTRCRLPADTATLSRRLAARVEAKDLEALNHAGFIKFVASATLAEGYHAASKVASAHATREEVEVEVEKPAEQSRSKTTAEWTSEPLGTADEESDKEHEHERELVRFSDDNGMSPLADTIQELQEKWSA